MKNVNTKQKTENDINIFNDWDSRNRGERHAPGKIIFQRGKKSKQVYESSSLKCIQASISIYLIDGTCW